MGTEVQTSTLPYRSNIDGLKASLNKSRSFALDLETTGLDFMTDRIVVVAITTEDGTWSLPLIGSNAVSFIALRDILDPVFARPSKTWYSWNGKFDLNFLRTNGFNVQNKIVDGMVAIYVLNTQISITRNDKNSFLQLGTCADHFLGIKLDKTITKQFVGIKELLPHHLEYAAMDAKATYDLCGRFLSELKRRKELYKVFRDISMPLLPVLSEMECNGINIDMFVIEGFEKELEEKIDEDRKGITKYLGETNINSNQQLSRVLFQDKGALLKVLPDHPKTKDPKNKNGYYYSTSEENLKKYDHPVITHLLDYSKKEKLLGTYVKPIQSKVQASPDGRLRGGFNQTFTRTSRLSSSKPNLQNIPSKIREGFIPSAGHKLIVTDFSQIEFRMAGYIAKKKFGHSNIADAFMIDKTDLHEATRVKMEAMGYEDFAKDCPNARRNAKIVNFAFVYGRGARTYASEYKLSIEEAIKHREAFHDSWPELQEMQKVCLNDIVTKGYVKSITGRRIQFQHCKGKTKYECSWDGWIAFNALIQSSAQEVIKIAMRNLNRRIRSAPVFTPIRFLIQVHDELVNEAPIEFVEEAQKIIVEEMENAVRPPEMDFLVESNICDNWKEGK